MDDVQKTYNMPLEDTSPMSVKDWMIDFFILCIPFVNIIMLFVWAFGGENNINEKKFARAALLFIPIGVVGILVLFVIMVISEGGMD
jgi:hypothetical protein